MKFGLLSAVCFTAAISVVLSQKTDDRSTGDKIIDAGKDIWNNVKTDGKYDWNINRKGDSVFAGQIPGSNKLNLGAGLNFKVGKSGNFHVGGSPFNGGSFGIGLKIPLFGRK